jgi:hypothetical protein
MRLRVAAWPSRLRLLEGLSLTITRERRRAAPIGWAMLAVLALGAPTVAGAEEAPAAAVELPAPVGPPPRFRLPAQPELAPKAIELLQAMSARLTGARTLSFKALATYESPARTGAPLAYTTLSEVALQRPDKLQVLTLGDGPPSEFYYDGKTMQAYSPWSDLVAVADAPATIDATLKLAYDTAGIYFPFTDVIVDAPYKDLAEGLRLAFVMGQSHVVGGTLTDMVVIANEDLQMQIWIGAEDHLPRRLRATFFAEAGGFRHDVELSDWRLDPVLPAGTFASERAAKAPRIAFAHPAHPPQPAQ